MKATVEKNTISLNDANDVIYENCMRQNNKLFNLANSPIRLQGVNDLKE